jgi:hypothetical protein
MAAGPKGVAGRPASLPAQQAAADPLQSYCPDLDQWPDSWAYEPRDIPYGLRMVDCFKPFLRELLDLPLSRKTLRRHRDNIWVLGGELISQLQMDSGLRRRPIEQLLLDLIGDDGGPLLSHGQSESRAAFLRRNLPQAVSLPSEPPKRCTALYCGDEPIAALTASMQTSWPCVSPSSPAAAQRCAAGAGLDGDPCGQGTIGHAVRSAATNQNTLNYPQFPPRNHKL